jgi:predicted DNA-binding transcriptional regulator YafY
LLDVRDTYIGWMPPFADVPVPSRLVEGETLSLLLDTIRHQRCVRITYQSDSEADPIKRVISPHAFGYDGFRWHVRAYCFLREGYRDFVLGRILNICADATQGRESKHDIKWHRFLQVKIAANPDLTEGNRRAVELDYTMVDGKTDIEVREALLYYVLKQLGLGPFAFPGFQPPQIVLLNKDELAPYIKQMFSPNMLPIEEVNI